MNILGEKKDSQVQFFYENVHKYARPENVPEHTMFVITTDEMENASRR